MNLDTEKKEEKPLDSFFDNVRQQTRQAGANAKLRNLMVFILENQTVKVSPDQTNTLISMTPEQFVTLCRLTGIKPDIARTEDGQENNLCPGSEETDRPDLSVQDQGDDAEADSGSPEPMAGEGIQPAD